MKRLMYILFTSGALLAACAGTTQDENEPNEVQETESVENMDGEASAEEMAPASDEEIEQADTVSESLDYEELAYQDVFNPEEYDARLITDNPGTRVFIFRDGEQQVYKTVYIKSDNRLKLIDIANNQLLLNEQIN